MLKLDEKKIRKGKPVGLPYVGSKKKVSKKIAQIIAQNFGTNKPVYDLFGGGGAISLELKLNGFKDVHYNELDKMTFAALKTALHDDFDVRDLIVTRDEFFKIRDSEHGGMDELKLLVNSFGNDRRSYIYSKLVSDAKTNLAKQIVWEESDWRQYKQTETYKSSEIKQIEQIERIQQIQQIQRIEPVDLECTNFDYKHFSDLFGGVLYLDPPYEKATDKYKLESFDSAGFYDWAYEMSKQNVVIISSYEVSDERFEEVFEFKTARSRLNAQSVGSRTEKLFMVKEGSFNG